MKLSDMESKIHPYIINKEGVCGGRSIIEGTRVAVWSIIKWYKIGMSIEEIIAGFPHLTPAQVYDAFSYYYDNQEEIKKDIEENEDESFYRNIQ